MKLHPESELGSMEHAGATIPFQDTGTPSDGRVPIVLVHGTGGTSATSFRTVFPMLAARHRVIALDLSVQPDHELEDLAAQVEALIEHRAPGVPVHLVGYSLGSVIVTTLAGKRPDLIKTLTLLAGWAVTDKQQRLRYDIWESLRAGDDERTLQEFQTLMVHSPRFLRSRTEKDLETIISSRGFREGIDAEMRINRGIDLTEAIAHITAPTLVIGCSEDQMVPIVHSYVLLGGIKDARFAEIDAGHAVTTERPAQVFMLIDDFVTDPAGHPAGSTIPHYTI